MNDRLTDEAVNRILDQIGEDLAEELQDASSRALLQKVLREVHEITKGSPGTTFRLEVLDSGIKVTVSGKFGPDGSGSGCVEFEKWEGETL